MHPQPAEPTQPTCHPPLWQIAILEFPVVGMVCIGLALLYFAANYFYDPQSSYALAAIVAILILAIGVVLERRLVEKRPKGTFNLTMKGRGIVLFIVSYLLSLFLLIALGGLGTYLVRGEDAHAVVQKAHEIWVFASGFLLLEYLSILFEKRGWAQRLSRADYKPYDGPPTLDL